MPSNIDYKTIIIAVFFSVILSTGARASASTISEKTNISITDVSPWFTKGTYSGSGPWYLHVYEGHDYISTYVGGMPGNPSQPDCWAKFNPSLSQLCEYDVYAYFYACKDTSTTVPFTVYYNGGVTTINVNQYSFSPDWKEVKLGTWNFAAGESTCVMVTDATGENFNGVTGLTIGSVKFVNVNQPPSSPTLISPGLSSEPGPDITTLTPTFRWNSVPNADYYGLYISKYPYGSGNIVFDSEVHYGPIYGISSTLPSGYLQDGVKYRWNMRSHNSAGWSDISNTLYFQMEPLVIVPSQILSPVTGSLEVVSTFDACSNTKWCFNQHQTGGHGHGGGIGQADDTFAWDANLNYPAWDADDGKSVYAIASGVIADTYGSRINAGGSYGQVLVEHTYQGNKWWSGYLHLASIQVSPGQTVTENTVLGYISNVSPESIPNHLHIAVYSGSNTLGGLVPFTASIVERTPTNQLPAITDLSQFHTDGTTTINEGDITTESTVVFKGTMSDQDSDAVKLEIELREAAQAFTGTPTPETISELVSSGSGVTITRYGLVIGDYHWQARAVDERGLASEWVEFGTAGNTDFIISISDIGYAVIVAGDDTSRFGTDGISANANTAYQALRDLGFGDERIFYLNGDRPQDIDGDGDDEVDQISSKSEFQNVMEHWVPERVGEHSPFILYLVGHGTTETFWVSDTEYVSPSILDPWLGELPSGTQMLIVIDSCCSGSFITEPGGEISAPNRVLITSASDNSLSDTLLFVGSLFSQEFWQRLGQGQNVMDAFIGATDDANLIGKFSGNFWDPWIDDNGDAVGHSPLFLGDDGYFATTMIIGVLEGPPSVGEDGPSPQVFTDCYDRNGGASILGYPINNVHRWGNGYIQDFRGGQGYEGAIMQPDGEDRAYAVYGCIWSRYLTLGGAEGSLGYPLNDESPLPPSSISSAECLYNNFHGGSIVHHATGAQAGLTVFLGHGIFNKWEELGFGGGVLGLPSSDEREAPQSGAEGFDTTGVVCDFEGGHLYWHRTGALANQAYETHGAIDSVYTQMDRSDSWLGFPVKDEYNNDFGYPQSDFEGGYITTIDGVSYKAFPRALVTLEILTPLDGSIIEGAFDITFKITNTGDENIVFMEGDAFNRIDLEIEYSSADPTTGWGIMLWSTSHYGLTFNSGENFTQIVVYDPTEHSPPQGFVGDAPYGDATIRLVHWRRIGDSGYDKLVFDEIEIHLLAVVPALALIESVDISVYHDSWEYDIKTTTETQATWYIFNCYENLVHTYASTSWGTDQDGIFGGYIPDGGDGYIHLKVVSQDGDIEWWPSAGEMYRIDRPPPIPHMFYGYVTIDGDLASDGISVEAVIDGVVYEEITTLGGWYGLFEVPADDPDTPEKEGGVPGDLVELYLDGTYACRSAIFENGGETWLDIDVITGTLAPHQFYGTVTIDGVPAHDGAWIDIVIVTADGGEFYYSTETSVGSYGYDPLFIVPADDPCTPEIEGGVNGDTVYFYVDLVYATSYVYENGMVTELDLDVTTAVYEIQLYEGWNLISIPCIPEVPYIELMLYDIMPYVESVWTYDGETGYWSSYSPGAPSDLTEMVNGKGYWIKMTTYVLWEIDIC